jgi:hypothetical protein
MSVAEEIRDQQKKAWKEMNHKEKLSYFWDYYKIHTIVAVVVITFVGTIIYQQVTRKESAFDAAFVNADTYSIDTDAMCAEFAEYAGIDTDAYDVSMDSSITMSDDDATQMSLANNEKMVVLLQGGSLDVIVADTKVFEDYAQDGFFFDLEEILPAETLEQYKDRLYYTDAASILDVDDEEYDADESTGESVDPWEESSKVDNLIINHHDPSSMEEPVAVGICLSADDKLMQTGCYDYLTDTNVTYQGYPSEAVFGIPVTSTKQDTALQFLEYILQ